jgi:hypothetical protein
VQDNKANNIYGGEGSSDMVNGGNKVNKCSIKFLVPKEKDIELIRENGKSEVIKLVK